MDAIELAGFLLNAGVILVGAVWAVSRMVKSNALTNANLDKLSSVTNANLEHLSESITRLSESIDRVHKRLDTHERRIIRLEEQGNHGQAV